MKNLTWQNPEQLFVAQELINKVKSKCCGIKVNNGGIFFNNGGIFVNNGGIFVNNGEFDVYSVKTTNNHGWLGWFNKPSIRP